MTKIEAQPNIYSAAAREILAIERLEAAGEPFSSFRVSGIPYCQVVNPILASYYLPLAITGHRLYRALYFTFLHVRMAWRNYSGTSRSAGVRPAAPAGIVGRKPVLFLNFWENHYPQIFSSLEKLPAYEKNFYSVLAGLRPSNTGPCQLSVHDYFPGERLEDVEAIGPAKRRLAEFKRLALADGSLTDAAREIRVNYFRLLSRSLSYEFKSFSEFWRSAEAMLSEVKPALVCAADCCDVRCRAFFLIAKSRGIPTLVLQQGLVSDAQSEFFFPVSDKVALWDEESLRILVGMGLSEQDFQVTGNPGYDKYFAPPPAQGPAKRTLLFISQPHHRHGLPKDKMDRMKRSVLTALERMTEFEVLVKPHPDEPASLFNELVAEMGLKNIQVLPPGADTGAYIAGAYALVGFYSTALIEGILAGKPVVVFDDEGNYNRFAGYEKDGAAYGARNSDEICAFFRAYERDGALRQSLREGRAKFAKRRIGDTGGKATVNFFNIMAGLTAKSITDKERG